MPDAIRLLQWVACVSVSIAEMMKYVMQLLEMSYSSMSVLKISWKTMRTKTRTTTVNTA